MELNSVTLTQLPMGMEKETALLAEELRHRYQDFFNWMQEEEKTFEPLPMGLIEQFHKASITEAQREEEHENFSDYEQEPERWFLSKWDIEYLYALSRPADVVCSCPFGWMEKVERLIDQQYPIFGIERFPDLFDKAAHMAYLLVRNEIFPSYNEGIAVLAALVLLQRNGEEVHVDSNQLKLFVSAIYGSIKEEENLSAGDGEDQVVKLLGQLLRGREG